MDTQNLKLLITKYTSVIFLIFASLCLLTNSPTAAHIYTVIYILLTFIAMPIYFLMLFAPRKMGMRMSICKDKKGKTDIDISVWDAYIKKYENRYNHLQAWVGFISHLGILAMFMAAGIWFVIYIDITCTVIGDAATWRLYRTIKNNKSMWGAASFLVDLQESLKQLGSQKKVGDR